MENIQDNEITTEASTQKQEIYKTPQYTRNAVNNYNNKKKSENLEEFLARKREISKKHYDTHKKKKNNDNNIVVNIENITLKEM